MLLVKEKIISAVAGLAMLAIPVSAFAGHRHDTFRPAPPFAPHDRGFHNGWVNHPRPLPPAPGFGRPVYHQPPSEFIAVPRPIGWNNGWHEEEEEEEHEHESHWRPQNWHPQVQAPSYGCDEDGDDCEGYEPQYQPGYDNGSKYGGQPYSWYMTPAPSSYSADQQLSWLISRRQAAMGLIAQMRARGDSRGADRVVKRVVNPLTAQINARQRQLGYTYNTTNYGYAPTSYTAPVNPLLGTLTGNPAYYGAAANNPTLNAIAAVAPLLGIH